jgi:hypothetical protein
MKKHIKNLILFLFSIFLYIDCYAQQLNLKEGDKYIVVSVMSSTMGMKRGDKQIDAKSISSVTKSYHITAANDDGYKLTITTKQIVDTVDAFDQKELFNSTDKVVPNSRFASVLNKMIGQTQTLTLDKQGKIIKVDNETLALTNAALASAVGLYDNLLVKGNSINFSVNYKLPTGAKVGTEWAESIKQADVTGNTKYTVEQITETFTKVKFKSEQTEPGINVNMNGTMVIDNATGVVLQRIIKSHSVSNERNSDNKSFIASRKSVISEICVKEK